MSFIAGVRGARQVSWSALDHAREHRKYLSYRWERSVSDGEASGRACEVR